MGAVSRMKNILVILIFLAILYQLFFRYDHWTGGPNNSILYERDSLTGKIRTILPKLTLSSMIHEADKLHIPHPADNPVSTHLATMAEPALRQARVSIQKYLSPPASPEKESSPRHETVPLPGSASSETAENPHGETFAFSMLEQQASTIKERARLALANGNPVGPPEPGKQRAPEVASVSGKLAKASAVPQKSISKDLNSDGSDETIMMVKQSEDGLKDISVMSGMKEVFFGRGDKLTVLPSKKAGWYDLELAIKGKEPILYHYNPVLEGYEAQDN